VFETDSICVESPSWGGDRVGVVWLNRGSKLNTLGTWVLEDIIRVFSFLQNEWFAKGTLKVVIILAKGRMFSAGADLKEEPKRFKPFETATEKADYFRKWRYDLQLGRRAMQAIEELEAVTICGVHGHVMGGAWCISLCCDYTVATEDCIFQMPEIDIQLPLTWGCTPRVIRQFGTMKAKEIIMLGERFTGKELYDLGGINKLVNSKEALTEATKTIAKRFVAKDPVALHMVKTQFRALARAHSLGDTTESDGDLLFLPAVLKHYQRSTL